MIAWLAGFASLAAGASSLGLLFGGDYAPAACLHVAAGLAGGYGGMRLRRPVRGGGLFEFVVGLGVPCVGGVLAWLHGAGERLARQGKVAREFAEYIDASMRLGEAQLPEVRRSSAPSPDQVGPMLDVLRSDAGEDDKRNAIEALSRLETPAAVETLRSVLTSESTEVRFYAASALSRLEERLALRLKALEDDLAMARRERGVVELEMARTYFDYAYYRLADETRRTDFLERSSLHAQRALEEGGDASAALAAGKALLELGRCAEAEEAFSRYLELTSDDVKGLLWRAESRFRLGRYPGVREDCARVRDLGGAPKVMAGALEMWAGRAVAAQRRTGG